MKIIIFLFIISSYASAQPIGVFRNSINRHLTLHSSNCEALVREANALTEWRETLGQPVRPVRTYREEGHCYIDVDPVTPDLVRERYSTYAREHGPNCFNTALTASGVLSHLRHTDANELEFWLTSPLCRTVTREELAPGDVISIRDDRGAHVHSFNYISENLAFTKDGYELQQQYNIRKTSDVLAAYHRPAFCRTGCTDEYRRCTSIEKYMTEHPFPDEELRQQWEAVTALECQGSDIAMGVSSLPADLNSLVSSSMEALATLTAQKSQDSSLTQEQRFLWQAMKLKIDSIRLQFRLIADRPRRS